MKIYENISGTEQEVFSSAVLDTDANSIDNILEARIEIKPRSGHSDMVHYY